MGIPEVKVTQVPGSESGSRGSFGVHAESREAAGPVAVGGSGEPVFFAAGREATGEFRCAECGYGAIVRSVLPPCPMCRGLVWEDPAGSPFAG